MSGAVARARRLLTNPQAWIEGRDGAYRLRLGPDRRARVVLAFDEAAFVALVGDPGLRRRASGGWSALPASVAPERPAPGRPGVIEGERPLMRPDGRIVRHRANLGEGPVAWLARRRDAEGRPWLTPAQIAAGERLRADAERAASGPSLTMRWDALPRSAGGSVARVEPGDAALAASRRVAAALSAIGPRLRGPILGMVVHSTPLQLAEQDHGLRRREGKTLLKEGLQALADHYGIG